MIATNITLKEINERNINTMLNTLEIEFTEITPDYLIAKMPVNKHTRQPLGLLHGGASAALAETVGSTAAYLSVDRDKYYTLGLEIKCNHIRSINEGYVYGKATPIHIGRRTHVWQIHITDEQNNLICLSTLTMAVLDLDEGMKAKFGDLFFATG